MAKKKPVTPVFPIGTLVEFICDNLGASHPDDLSRIVPEVFGTGDRGIVRSALQHPELSERWVYVEVDSRAVAGQKLLVAVTKDHARAVG